MKTRKLLLPFFVYLFQALSAAATVHYVSLNGVNPVPPYTDWSTAATNIQDAVNAAQAGDTVIAGDGVYSVGGTVVYGAENNLVALTNGVTLMSLDGPQAASIVGGTQMRGVYVGSNSILSGFTVTNGYASTSGDAIKEQSGGGLWCEPGGVASNCVVAGCSAANDDGGGSYGGIFYNCVLTNNYGNRGGGVYGGTLYNCTLSGNVGLYGAGAGTSTLWNCNLIGNSARQQGTVYGAGAYGSALFYCNISNNIVGSYSEGGGTYQCLCSNCVITGNALGYSYGLNGGGTYEGTNYNCMILNHLAANYGLSAGGGTYNSTNYNCVIAGNQVNDEGGGAYAGVLYNCTVVSNAVVSPYINSYGGGVDGGTIYNSIVYFNSASSGSNWSGSTVNYCCTAPLPGGPGNLAANPLFVDPAGDFRLQCGSPCIDAGSVYDLPAPTHADIRGVSRPQDGSNPCIGAYEFDPPADFGPSIRWEYTIPVVLPNKNVPFAVGIGGCQSSYFWWDFGDGVTLTNQNYVSHAWASTGNYNVTVTAYYPAETEFLSATTQVQVLPQPVFYVNASNAAPSYPYTNWTTAATNIQQAVAAGGTPGRLVLVTNGFYQAPGWAVYGTMTNSVVLMEDVEVASVNGPTVTTIQPVLGRCVYLGSNAILSGFTLTGGQTLSNSDLYQGESGGGIWCEPGGVASNCVITANTAAYSGGGAYQGTFYNCNFNNNSAVFGGGGACQSVLYNCKLVSNQTLYEYVGFSGGGALGGALVNCQIQDNYSPCGGGACLARLTNCVLSGNDAGEGGGSCSNTLWGCQLTDNESSSGAGAYYSTLYNCIINNNNGDGAYGCDVFQCTIAGNTRYGFNTPGTNRAYNSILYFNGFNIYLAGYNNWNGNLLAYYCCTTPLPTGLASITNNPLFTNYPAGDFYLHYGSPCIDTGTNLSAIITNDIQGTPRPLDGTGDGVPGFDMGAYQFNLVAAIGTNWLTGYGLNPSDPLLLTSHPNGCPMTVAQSWVANLNPTNPNSVFQISTFAASPHPLVLVQTSPNREYTLFSSTNPAAGWVPVAGSINVSGYGGTIGLSDPANPPPPDNFYRVGVFVP